jgi:hypothetical protein
MGAVVVIDLALSCAGEVGIGSSCKDFASLLRRVKIEIKGDRTAEAAEAAEERRGGDRKRGGDPIGAMYDSV